MFSVSAESVIPVNLLLWSKKAAPASFPMLATFPKCVSDMTMISLQLPYNVSVYFYCFIKGWCLFKKANANIYHV